MAKVYPFSKKTLEDVKDFFGKLSPVLLFLIPALGVAAIVLAVVGTFQILGSNYNFFTSPDPNVEETETPELETIYIGEERIEVKVETADSTEEWINGLMNRTYLPADQGMLFIFPDENIRSFWMKNTYIPLDIIYINSDKEIINFYESVEPLNEVKSYTSDSGAKYVLEVNGGFVQENKIQEGMKVYF